MVERFAQTPSIMTGMVIEHFHGAVTRVPATATAFPHREPGYNLVIPGVRSNAKDDDANIAWVRDTYDALTPYVAESVYVNYLADDDTSRLRPLLGAAAAGQARLRPWQRFSPLPEHRALAPATT